MAGVRPSEATMLPSRWWRRGGAVGGGGPGGAATAPGGRSARAAGAGARAAPESADAGDAYLIPYGSSSHERAIAAHFGGDVGFDPARHVHAAPGAIFVCFSNRSGSNFLAAALASSGRLRPAGEAFNAPVVVERAKAAGHASFQAYVEDLAGRTAAEGRPLLVKLGWMQLFLLDKAGLLDGVFPEPRFVHIRRDDLLGQAVSHAVAQATKAWTSRAAAAREPAVDEVAFDWARIRRHVAEFAEANAYFDRFFALTGRPVTRVVYESLVADPAGWVAGFGAATGLPLAYVPERVRLERQDDPRKAEFRARALDMARRRAWADPPA